MASFKLPRLKANLAIVNGQGRPLDYFLRLFNIELAQKIEEQESTQDDTIRDIQSILEQLQALSQSTQQAQSAANTAQATADGASGSGAVSGESTDPDLTITGSGWVNGPQVDLTGVIAGTLTITGSGPVWDSNVGSNFIPSNIPCEFRIVEIVGGVDEVLFTGTFSVNTYTNKFGEDATTVTNQSAAAVSAFSSARSSTGAVSYRIDARKLATPSVFNLLMYLFVRRA